MQGKGHDRRSALRRAISLDLPRIICVIARITVLLLGVLERPIKKVDFVDAGAPRRCTIQNQPSAALSETRSSTPQYGLDAARAF